MCLHSFDLHSSSSRSHCYYPIVQIEKLSSTMEIPSLRGLSGGARCVPRLSQSRALSLNPLVWALFRQMAVNQPQARAG